MNYTLKLTENDYCTLILMLGFAAGAKMQRHEEIPETWKELTDWILTQGRPENKTYYHAVYADLIRKQKEVILLQTLKRFPPEEYK
jgi:hypothetical protein